MQKLYMLKTMVTVNTSLQASQKIPSLRARRFSPLNSSTVCYAQTLGS